MKMLSRYQIPNLLFSYLYRQFTVLIIFRRPNRKDCDLFRWARNESRTGLDRDIVPILIFRGK
jgi:hypothetical protein